MNKWKIAAILFGVAVVVESLVLHNIFYFKGGSLNLPGAFFRDYGDDISAVGSWISDSNSGIIGEQRINTTEISCLQSRKLCIEARAYKGDIGSGNLLAQILEY